MLKNHFRRLVGILIVGVFLVAVFQFARQTSGSPHVLAALTSGMWLLAFLAAVVWVAWWADRRARARGK